MSAEQKKEVGRFMLVGLVGTVIDYTLLNIFAVLLGLPLLIANSISAPFSSFIGYKLNKRVVFEDRMHGRRKTVLLYGAILAFGILVIQNTILHFVSGSFAWQIAEFVQPAIVFVGLGDVELGTIAINAAKVCASLTAALWNYLMLRRFVFVTQEEAKN